MNRPKKVSMFPVARPAESERYRPQRTLNSELAELYQQSGERGIVINRGQRIALDSILDVYERTPEDEVQRFAMLAAMTCFGTSYYSFTEHSSGNVMNKTIYLPKGYDENTGNVFDSKQLDEMLRNRLYEEITQAAITAEAIEKSRGEAPKVKLERSLSLGKTLAHVSLVAAAIGQGVSGRGHENAADVQNDFWLAGEVMKEQTKVVANRTGAIPSLAQLANPQSPLRRDMIDNPELLISERTHERLDTSIDVRGRF